jgi:peptide/nickel transport system substrate-binding protein
MFGGNTIMVTKIVIILLGLTLVLAVACGSAPAAPDPTATSPAAPASDAAPTTAPTAPVVSDTAQPTSTPQVAAPPAEVEVNPGKLTIMVGDLATEQFGAVFGGGNAGEHNYYRIIGGYLISTNERTEMVPGIASEWDLSDDGLTWIFTIRKGVKFHDGSELTPEDVLWTLQYVFGPEVVTNYNVSSVQAILSRGMDRIELSEPDKVSMITKEPVPQLALWVSEADAKNFHMIPKRPKLHDPEADASYDSNPIGAGFMRLQKHVPASVMTFERFDDFYYQPANGFPEDKRVNFRSLDLFLVPEEATRVAALRSGEADIIPASAAAKEQVEDGGGRLIFGQEGVFVDVRLLGCWVDPSFPCADKRVRQALAYAIDKELIRDRLFGGPEVFQIKGWDVVTPSTIGYTPELDPFPFDPDKARQLLADAGYPGGQGFDKLMVNTWPSTAMPLQVESAQLAADMWRRELGLDVEVRVSDSTGMEEREDAGELNGQVLWRENETRIDATGILGSQYGEPESPTRFHEDPELFSLVQETFQILDSDKREEAYKKLFVRLRDESYMLGIGYANIPWGVGPRVLTWEPYPLAVYPSALHTITLK